MLMTLQQYSTFHPPKEVIMWQKSITMDFHVYATEGLLIHNPLDAKGVLLPNYRPLFLTVVGMHTDLEVHSHTRGIFAA